MLLKIDITIRVKQMYSERINKINNQTQKRIEQLK